MHSLMTTRQGTSGQSRSSYKPIHITACSTGAHAIGDAARLVGEALKKAGKDLTREKLVSTLEGMQNFDLGGFKVSYGPNSRSGSRYVELTVVGAGGKVIK